MSLGTETQIQKHKYVWKYNFHSSVKCLSVQTTSSTWVRQTDRQTVGSVYAHYVTTQMDVFVHLSISQLVHINPYAPTVIWINTCGDFKLHRVFSDLFFYNKATGLKRLMRPSPHLILICRRYFLEKMMERNITQHTIKTISYVPFAKTSKKQHWLSFLPLAFVSSIYCVFRLQDKLKLKIQPNFSLCRSTTHDPTFWIMFSSSAALL